MGPIDAQQGPGEIGIAELAVAEFAVVQLQGALGWRGAIGRLGPLQEPDGGGVTPSSEVPARCDTSGPVVDP